MEIGQILGCFSPVLGAVTRKIWQPCRHLVHRVRRQTLLQQTLFRQMLFWQPTVRKTQYIF